MKTKSLKIILDCIMAVSILFLYKKNVLTLTVHEIAGVIICVLFIVHVLLNKKWVVALTKTLFSKTSTIRAKISYIVDFLLAISFLGILITGIGISKTVFKSFAFIGAKGNPYHFFFSGLSLILLGIHIGLHWKWTKANILKFYDKSIKPIKVTINAVIIAISCWGVYALSKSSMGLWLTAIFKNGNSQIGGMGRGPGGGKGKGVQNITFSNIFQTFITFLSITILFAFVTVMIEKIINYVANQGKKKLQLTTGSN